MGLLQAVTARATGAWQRAAMENDDKPAAPPLYGCHLGMAQYSRDKRTPEERAAAESREWARRKGRRRREWWKADTGKGPAR